MIVQEDFLISTSGRSTTEITREIQGVVSESRIEKGLCHVFVKHTSASLIVCENADPDVRHDLETFMQQLVPDGDPMFCHDAEGPDDMPAHVRSILTNVSITIPISAARCQLGTWQGVYLWEHRTAPHQRQVLITITGE